MINNGFELDCFSISEKHDTLRIYFDLHSLARALISRAFDNGHLDTNSAEHGYYNGLRINH